MMLNRKLLALTFFSTMVSLYFLDAAAYQNKVTAEASIPEVASDFVYGEGSSEITTQTSQYDTILSNKPFKISILITHNANDAIDPASFQMGNKPIKPTFVQKTEMSVSGNTEVAIYSFEAAPLPVGSHTLPGISVKVAGKKVEALPLSIEILN